MLLRLILIAFPFVLAAITPLIESKKFQDNQVQFKLNKKFRRQYVNQDLTISYPSDINIRNLPNSIIEIPLITSSIAVIWISGNQYSIEEMDEDLFNSLIKIKEFFRRYFCNTSWDGELVPKRLVKNTLPVTVRPAMLFTAGLDSTATLFKHFDENPILISYNDPNEIAAAFAKQYHFDFHTIYVNHEQFLKRAYLSTLSCDIEEWLWDTSLGLTFIGIAAPFLYAKGISNFYISPDSHWLAHIFPDGLPMQRAACPIIDENLSPMGIKVTHALFDMTRVDKVEWVSKFCTQNGLPKPQLTVCWQPRTIPNCNRCEKCFRTMFEIIAVGEDPRDYGFLLSTDEFIKQFSAFMKHFKIKTRLIYSYHRDVQLALIKNLEKLPQEYRTFYEGFINIDLWSLIDEPPRPPRLTPFSWDDYRDLFNVPPLT